VLSSRHYTSVRSAPALRSGSIPQAFAIRQAGNFRNAGRNILRGPGTFHIDFSAHKVFTLRERLRLQYRAEFFNVLKPHTIEQPGFFREQQHLRGITSARDPRIIQMALN